MIVTGTNIAFHNITQLGLWLHWNFEIYPETYKP